MLAAYSTMARKRSLQAKCYRYPHKQLLACRSECQQVVCAAPTMAIQSERKLWGGYEQRVRSRRGKVLKHMKDILLHSWRDAWKLKVHWDAISHLTDGHKDKSLSIYSVGEAVETCILIHCSWICKLGAPVWRTFRQQLSTLIMRS